MKLLAVDAPALLARSAAGARPLATRIAHGELPADALQTRATTVADREHPVAGRVNSADRWVDTVEHARLASARGSAAGGALRPSFEWYLCRSAFFHNDAHFADVLFGVWYIAGPRVDLVFPRAHVRIEARPGTFAVFDPFEVHGVLPPGTTAWNADAPVAGTSVFAGFEIGLTPEVAALFGSDGPLPARVVSSATRIDAATGALG